MVVVYKYGLKEPSNWSPEFSRHLELQCDLWNDLVKIEDRFREAYNKLIYSKSPDLVNLDGRVHFMVKNGSSGREIMQVSKEASELRAEIKKSAAGEIKDLEDDRWDDVKRVRAQSGLWWGNYNTVVANYESSRVQVMRKNSRLKKKRFSGYGSFCVQVQGGVSVKDFMDGGYLLSSIEAPKEPSSGVAASKASERHVTLKMTVYTAGNGRDRRQLEIPMVLHRPLPENGVIKSISVNCKNLGGKTKWAAYFTIEVPQPQVEPVGAARAQVVGIDFGWRITPVGIRVAVWSGSDGKAGDVILPTTWIERMKWSQGLMKKAQKWREDIVNKILSAVEADKSNEAAQRLFGKKIPTGRLQDVLEDWAEKLPEWHPDLRAAGFSELAKLRRDEIEAANLRDKLSSQRRHIYAQAAMEIAQRYSILGIEDLALRKIAKAMESDDSTPGQVHMHRQMANITELRHWLIHQGNKKGCDVRILSATNTTSACNECGHLNKGVAKKGVYVTCQACGAKWDQDVNAASNLRDLAIKPQDQ